MEIVPFMLAFMYAASTREHSALLRDIMNEHYAALLPITKEYCSADEGRLFFTSLSKTVRVVRR